MSKFFGRLEPSTDVFIYFQKHDNKNNKRRVYILNLSLKSSCIYM